jgi:hypothetical protein
LSIAHLGLVFLYVCLWFADGVVLGRIIRRYCDEEKQGWPGGKFKYTFKWVLSLAWLVGSAIAMGELNNRGGLIRMHTWVETQFQERIHPGSSAPVIASCRMAGQLVT